MRETVKPVPEPTPEPAEPSETVAKRSYPLPATIIICLLPLLALFGGEGREASVTSDAQGMGFVVGWALGGVFLWGIAWLVTIRHASRGWKWGSLAAVVAVGLLTGLARLT